jgi:hypothetical protein
MARFASIFDETASDDRRVWQDGIDSAASATAKAATA